MKKYKIGFALALVAGMISSLAQAATTYAPPHGALVAGEATVVDNAGAKIFFPASVGGTLEASPTGAQVREDSVQYNATYKAGLQVRSTLDVAPRSGMTNVYVDSSSRAYLTNYNAYTADGSNNTAVASQSVLLDAAKYPGLSTATRLFPTYGGASVSSTYYLSGTSLYRTTALRPGAANSATATIIDTGVLDVVGVDGGVFVRTASGVTYYDAAGGAAGLSAIISPTVSSAEFKTITAVHDSYYVMVLATGDHQVFKIDGSYNNMITGTNKIGFVPYVNRSAQVAGHNGQTTFAWYTADYKISYINPYVGAASAIKSIDWSTTGGTKQNRANTIKFLSISEDGFVQYTGKNSSGTTYYIMIAANAATMTNVSSVSSTTASDATNSSAASVVWNNPSNTNWHYKVPSASFGSSGSKSYYWKWGLSGGKVVLTRMSTSSAVVSYTGGGRICRLSSQYYVVPNFSTQAGTGTTSYAGPINPCGTSSVTLAHANAADLTAGYVPVGAVDGSYIDSSANYTRTGSMSDLSSVGAPASVSGTMNPSVGFSGSAGWDPRQSMMFGIDGSGIPYVGGAMFGATSGSSMFVNFPISNTLTATASSAASPTTVSLNWNDPRDSRAGVTTWNVTTSRLVAAVPTDTVTQPGSPSTRTVTLDPQAAGFSHTFTASADLTVPVIGHRGAKITLNAANFTGALDQPPTITNPGTTELDANSNNFLVPLTVSDPDAGDTLNYTVSSPASHGSVTVNSGKYYYTPNANYVGADQFTAQVTDVAGATAVSNVALNVVCPDPVVSGMTLATSQDGPYRGTTGTLSYSSNACNGGLPVTFTVKDSHGTVIASATQVVTAADGVSQTKDYTFTNIPPGVNTVNARVLSNNKPAFTKDVVAATNYTSAPTSTPTLGSNKTTPTEDDDITVTAAALPLCPYYDNVSNARLNKGCFIEWGTSGGILSSTNPAANQLKVIGLRGAQSVTATVKAYNTDGTNFALDPVTLPLTIAPPVDVIVDHAFSKGGSYAQYTDNVGVTFAGNVSNQCQVVATDAQAQAVVDGGNHACVVQFTQIPSGMKQDSGALSLSGRLLNSSSNTIGYSVYRYYAPGVRTLINSDSFAVPTAATSYTVTPAISVNAPGYGVELSVTNGTACTQTALQSDAKASWGAVGQAKCLVEWTSIPAGLATATVNSKPGVSGTPSSGTDQAVGYKVYLVDDSDTKIEIASASGVVVDHAPSLTLPVSTLQIDTDSANAAVPGSSFSDSDAGDTVAVTISTAAQHGTASFAGGVLKYQPAPSYIGPDSFTVKVTDKYGVSKTGNVDVSVFCGLPTMGGITSPNAGGFWEVRPVSIQGFYSPAHSCHSGFTAQLEFLSAGGAVLQTVSAPSSDSTSTDGSGNAQNNPIYDNVSLAQGTYNTRLRLTSNADNSKVALIPGDQMIVIQAPAPSLSADKASPTEDDDVTVTATALPMCPYYSTVADARVNKGCFIEWSGSAGVMTIASAGANKAKVAAVQGAQSVTAVVKAYNTDGSYYTLPSATLPMTVAKAVDVGVKTTYSKGTAYTQYLDNVSATFSPNAGSLCSFAATAAQAQTIVDGGSHACLLEFNSLPVGIAQDAGALSVSGRVTAASGNDISYKVSRYYAPGKVTLINNGTTTISTSEFIPAVAPVINAEDIAGTKGYSVYADVTNASWNCVQTDVLSDAKASWAAVGEPKCLIEWSNIPSGLALATVSAKPGVKGIPATSTDQKISYRISVVDAAGQKYTLGSDTNAIVDHAPTLTAPGSITVDTDSAANTVAGVSTLDVDSGDTTTLVVSSAASHGTATVTGGTVNYQPAPSYVGPDSFELKLTDKYGVSTTKTVLADVICGMPTMGGVTTPNAAGFWENRPVDIVGKYSPAHSCHGGFTTHLEIVDSGNIVVKQITAPTSMTTSTDGNGQVQNNPVYDNVALTQGTYTSRLRIQSLADNSKEVVITGDQMIVVPVSAPSLSADKVTPTEDDDITVTATALPLCPYYATVADARVNKGCFIEWSGSAGVMSAVSTAPNKVKVAATQGNQTINALVKAYDTDGTYFALSPVSLPIDVSKAVDVGIDTTFSKAGSFSQYIDNASATFAAASGSLCTLHATESQAQVDLDAGKHACVLEFTGMPSGLAQDANALSVSGRLTAASGNNVLYRVARYYAPGKMKQINTGTATFSTAPFAPTVSIGINQEDVAGTPGYSVAASVTNGAWNCVQTGVNSDAKASWSAIGEPKCLVEWSNIPSGLALATVSGKPGVKGVPLTEGDQKISYAVSLVNNAGQKFVLGSATNTVVDHAPTIVVPSSFEVDTDSAQVVVSGISVTESDANDTATVSIGTAAQHGTAVYASGNVKYQPAASFVGADNFVVKGTDKYGVSASKNVVIDVACGMPTIGSIITPNSAGFWEVKPQNIAGHFSPTHSCHAGYQAKLELVNAQGNVAKQIDAPTTQANSTDGFGNPQRDLVYNNVSFDAGTYTTRLRLRSNAFPAKEVLLAGDEFVVQNVPSPTLVADKTSPSEDDVVTITASHNGCSSFAASAAEAVSNNNCYIDWTKTGTVSTMTRKGNDAVEITAQRGLGSVRATIRIPDSSGTLRGVSYADLSTTFTTGISAPIVSASFPQADYVQIVDYVTGGPIVENGGYDCQLVATQAQGQTIAVGGGRACLMNYTGVPAGMNVTTNGVTFEGRIINSNDKTFTYTLARVYADGSTAPVPGGQFVVPVKPMSIKAVVQTSKIAYAAGIQEALVSLKLDDVSANSVSCSQTSVESEAIASWNNAGVPKCLVTWTTVPNGLAVDSNSHTTLVGTPTAVTGNEVAYTVDFVDSYGTHYQALSGTGNLIVRTPVSPSYLMVAKNGTFIPDDGSDPYYLVADDGIAGTATVTGGDFANIHVLIRDVIGMTSKTTEVADQPSGSKVSVKVATDATNAWSTRNVSMSLGYEGLGDLLVNNVNVRIMRMPIAAMKVSVTTPKNVVDTAAFKVTLKTGEPDGRGVITYNRDKHGLWRAYLAEKNGLGALTPITQEIDISANDGSAVFDGLQASTLQGKTIVGVVVPNVPGGTLNGVTYNVMSDPLAITFIPGGELPATIKASRVSGSIPLGVRFDVAMDFSYRDDVGSVGWEYQLNGSDWISMTGVRGFTANYTFQEGGVYNVRAVITNKNTMVITQTSPIAITVKQALKLTLTPNSLSLPGTDITMNLAGTKPDGSPISFVSQWEIYRQGQAPEIVTDQLSYVFHSDTPQIINIKVKARPSELPAEDPESWVSVARTVQFAIPDKPRVSITGPVGLEAGVPQDFTVKIVPSWDPKISTSLTTAGKWVLPDGTEIPGSDRLNWAPNPEEVVSGGQIMKLKYVAWVVGAEEQTSWTVEKKISVRKYEFPTQKLTVRADTTYAPAFVTLTAVPATTADVKLMNGKKLTYTWSVPDGVIAKASGSRMVGTIDMPGTYTFSLLINDTRGNEQRLEYTVEIIQSRPYNMTVKATLGQKYNRPPAKYGLRVELSGGHPKDRVKNYSTFVDNVKVLDSGVRAPGLITIQTPGDHEIKVRMESVFGMIIEATTSVSVNPNVPPTCNPVVTWDTRGKYCTVRTNCADTDGLIRSYAWYVDDVLQVGKMVPNFTWIVPDGVTSGTIRFVATDDGGDSVTMDVPVSR